MIISKKKLNQNERAIQFNQNEITTEFLKNKNITIKDTIDILFFFQTSCIFRQEFVNKPIFDCYVLEISLYKR